MGKAAGSPGPHRSVYLQPPTSKGLVGPPQKGKQSKEKLETKPVVLEGLQVGGAGFYSRSAPQNSTSINIFLLLRASSGLSCFCG